MKVFQSELVVRSYEMDSLGHVNHAVYLSYLEQARYDALREGGVPHTELARRGWGVHVVRIEVAYRKPCVHGDRLRIRTTIESFRSSSMTASHQVYREAEGQGAAPAVTARVVLVWIGEDGRPMRIPTEARAALGG